MSATFVACQTKSHPSQTFTNPVLLSGPDPWAIYHDGNYYYMNTLGDRLAIWKTSNLANLKSAQKKIIWKSPSKGSYSHDIWAPELHLINGKWYVYFAADGGDNKDHRIYVIENDAADPLKGEWKFKGKVKTPDDKWAIDASIFNYHNQLYMIWSGWKDDHNGQQNIYIAKMKNPYATMGKRARISSPSYPWEEHGDLKSSNGLTHINVNEGPQILQHKDDLFLIYSASACWTDHYALGMLTLKSKNDLINGNAWEKSARPVFQQSPKDSVYATGHNSFFVSPDSSQYWILYHANSKPNQGCGETRSPRMQQFHWNKNGKPDFGTPVKTGVPIAIPSGE